MRYFSHDQRSIEHMLSAINKASLEELFASIPSSARFNGDLDLPPALDELSLKKALRSLSTSSSWISFLGAGACEHFVPEWVSQQLLRAEWYTSYTPYQAELSQGNLQAIFEFQTMCASLMGLDVANASMYDGASALAEALLMAVRITGIKRVALARTLHPEYRQCVATYLAFAGVAVDELAFSSAGISPLPLQHEPVAAFALQSPNFFGQLEHIKAWADHAHRHNALLIGCTTDISGWALLSSWGFDGADIAVGEGLGLVPGLSYGGPGVGLLACKQAYVRHLPGRLIGATTDKNGHYGYVLTLAAREQHIRREKASSNICTNHNLMALALSMSWAAYGHRGFYELGLRNVHKTELFRHSLAAYDETLLCFRGPYYNESVVDVKNPALLKKRLQRAAEHQLIAGLELSRFYPELPHHLLVATTEMHDDDAIKLVAAILGVAHD